METPFAFGKIVSGKDFTDREKETEHLIRNFKSGSHTVLLSPRRLGKSSLVLKAESVMTKENSKIKFCFIDLFNVRDEEEFYKIYSQNIIKTASSVPGEIFNIVKQYMSRFIPKLTFGSDPLNELSIGMDWKEVIQEPDEILDLPEKLSKSRKIKIIVCIDEFQNIGNFKDPLAFQKKLRAHWQKHQHTYYCLYGSKRHMMLEVFSNPSMPFYKFGELIFLNKITENNWTNFIIRRFKETGKKIDEKTAREIVRIAESHSYYVQQISQQTWLRTKYKCSTNIVKESVTGIINQLDFLFQNLTESLAKTQINFLRAIIDNVIHYSSNETIKIYHLGTSANVIRIKNALLEKEIIDVNGNEISFQDPIFKLWFKLRYPAAVGF